MFAVGDRLVIGRDRNESASVFRAGAGGGDGNGIGGVDVGDRDGACIVTGKQIGRAHV